jgi:hypothetical protein
MIDSKPALIPDCALCGKPVERVEWQNDFRTNSVVATAYCHGDTQVSVLSRCDIIDKTIGRGVAFQQNQLPMIEELCNVTVRD